MSSPYTRDKYIHYDENNCCLSILASALFDSREYVAENAIVLRLKEYLLCESKGCKNRIKFSNDIVIDKEIEKM